jgi:hypothetical protein
MRLSYENSNMAPGLGSNETFVKVLITSSSKYSGGTLSIVRAHRFMIYLLYSLENKIGVLLIKYEKLHRPLPLQ